MVENAQALKEYQSNPHAEVYAFKIMATKFRTRENAKPSVGEKMSEERVTVPDQSNSIREILQKFSQGIPPSMAGKPVYNESHQYPDLDKLDLVDILELKTQLKDESDSHRKYIKDAENEIKNREKQAANNAAQKEPNHPSE